MTAANKVVIPLNTSKLQSVTLFGAIGTCLVEPVYMTARATNIEEFKRFVVLLASKKRD